MNGVYACGNYNMIENLPIRDSGVLISVSSNPFAAQIYVARETIHFRITFEYGKTWGNWMVK